MKIFYSLILFLFSGSGIANAGTIHTAVWNGALNQEWTYGACSGSNLSAPPAGNGGFYCGYNGPYLPNVPVILTNWSVNPPFLPPPGQPLPPGNSDPGNSANDSFNIIIGSGAGVVTLGDPKYNNCPTNNCISSGLVYVDTLNIAATSGLKIYGTLEIQPQGNSSATLINSGEVILPGFLALGGTQPASISGGGLITLSGGTLQAGTLTSDNTIHGSGLVYTGGALTNTGVINADAAGVLTLQYGAS